MLFFFLKCVNPYLPPKPQQPHTHELSCPWVLGMVWHRPVCPSILTSYILLNLRHVVSKGCFHLLIEFVACLYVEFSFVSPCNFVSVCRVGRSVVSVGLSCRSVVLSVGLSDGRSIASVGIRSSSYRAIFQYCLYQEPPHLLYR